MIIMVLLPDVDTGSCPKFWFRIFHELRSHITHIYLMPKTQDSPDYWNLAVLRPPKTYPLVITNIAMEAMALIEIDGSPTNSMVILTMAM